MKNSGNEAKEYLKTKDIAFLNAANYARFARKLAQIEPKKEQKQRILRKRTGAFERNGAAGKGTICRLHERVAQAWALGPQLFRSYPNARRSATVRRP